MSPKIILTTEEIAEMPKPLQITIRQVGEDINIYASNGEVTELIAFFRSSVANGNIALFTCPIWHDELKKCFHLTEGDEVKVY